MRRRAPTGKSESAINVRMARVAEEANPTNGTTVVLAPRNPTIVQPAAGFVPTAGDAPDPKLAP